MMTNEKINIAMFEKGRADALNLQDRAEVLTADELYSENMIIPEFEKSCEIMNMLERPIGFVCKSPAGRIVKLLQNYDSSIYVDDPEDLPAQWGFEWSSNPEYALPFISISTSPYMKGNCCIENGKIYRSLIDTNIWAPSNYPGGWKVIE